MFSFTPPPILDCGASRVALGRFASDRTGARLVGIEVEALNLVDADWLAALRAALAALSARVPYRGPVTVLLPGHLVLAKAIKVPRLAPAKREKVIRFEAQQNIPYALSDVVWDYAVTGETDSGFDGLFCTAKTEALDALCAAVEAAGFQPRVLLPCLLALRAIAGTPETPTLYANCGARSTTLLLVEKQRWHARNLALGGQFVTQQLAESQNCDWTAAEALKISGRDPALVAPALEAFATRLGQEIARTVVHFQRLFGAASPGRLVLTGGAVRSGGFAALLAAKANVPVTILDPLTVPDSVRVAADAGFAGSTWQFADLLGAAALRNDATVAPGMNLLPPRWRTREDARRRQPWLAATALLAVAALVPPLEHYRAREAVLCEQAAAIEAVLAPLREREARNRANLEQLAALRQEAAALHGIAARRANWPQLLADLERRLVQVEDVWLDRVQVVTAPAESAAPLRLALSGRMLDRTNPLATASPDLQRRVAALLQSVAGSPFVEAVENERFDNRQPGMLRFEVELVATPARPL